MKKTDSIVLQTVAIGVAFGVGLWYFFPSSPWYFYAAIGVGTLIGIPKAIKDAADQKVAKQVLDE